MNHLARVVALASLATACMGSASAATLTLASYGLLTNSGTVNPTPAGVANTATIYAGGPSYNVSDRRHLVRPARGIQLGVGRSERLSEWRRASS